MKWLWLCCVAVVTFVAPMAEPQEDLPWWRTAVFYQVYPRSFKDSDGDGVGDLKGITEKAEYLSELGVTAIWISPIFKSPMADFGYDISDYRQIDPIFGTMEDLQELSEKLMDLNIKLLLDLVPNHSSDEHEWFQKSIRKEDPYTDYYVWHDGKIDSVTKQRSPPNNWISIFTGSTWTWNEDRGQYYLHNFDKKQPDLNYRNPAVVQEMDDEQLRDEPIREDGQLDHIYTQNLPETFELLRRWADIVHDYTMKDGKPRALFAEAYADIPTTLKYYGEGNESLLQPFNFQLLTSGNASTRATELKDLILTWLDDLPPGTTPNWVIGNHDNGRIADRYGPEMVDAMNLLTGVLPGVKVVYNGEEIGMQNTFIRWDQTVDPSGRLLGPYRYQFGSRDPERTPMQWDDSPNAGFSSSKTTWLPVNPNYWWLNVEAQRSAESSHLKVFQAMTAVRNTNVLLSGDLSVLTPDDDTLVVVRTYQNSSIVLLINMGSYITDYTTESLFSPLNLDFDMHVVTASVHSGIKPGAIFLEVYDTIPTTMKYYGKGTESLEFPFNFQLLTQGNQTTRPAEIKQIIDEWMTAMPNGCVANWVVGNHDNGRVADRYGHEMVDAINLLTGVLPGIKVVYNGEEIGMQNTFIRWDQTVDNSGRNLGPYHYQEGSRDPERTPMQWDDTLSSGFSSNDTTWLPVNPNYWWLNVEAQMAAESSHLKIFKELAAVRKDPVLQRGDLQVLVYENDTLIVVRHYNESYFALIINMGSEILTYTSENLFAPNGLDIDMTVVLGSMNLGLDKGTNLKKGSLSVSLRPKAAVLLKSGSSATSSSGRLYVTSALLICGLLALLFK